MKLTHLYLEIWKIYFSGFWTVRTDLKSFKVKNPKGKEIDVGSIASGGRYDKLISRFKGTDFPGTGMSIGVDRLLFVLSQIDAINTKNNEPVLICILDNKYIKKYIKTSSPELHVKNIIDDINKINNKFNKNKIVVIKSTVPPGTTE